MMTCNDIRRKLSAYMDDELEVEIYLKVDEHLKECDQCRQDLQARKEGWDFLKELHEPEPVPYFYTKLSARINSKRAERESSWIERILVPVSVTAVIVMGILMGNYFNRYANGQSVEVSAENDMLSYLNSFDDFPEHSISDAYFQIDDQE